MRLQSPTIAFKLVGTLMPSKDEASTGLRDRSLPNGVPASMNLLESLKSDPAAQGAKPKLSAARLSRMEGLAGGLSVSDHSIMVNEVKSLPALPAISSRVRYARASGQSGKPSVIASLDIETAPFSDEIVELTAIGMELPDGSTEDIGQSLMPLLPLKCHPKDVTVFLFRLIPFETLSDISNQTSARTVLIIVNATVCISASCQPKIQMKWKTGVDFATALNPVYGAPGQSMQRQRRPDSLSRAHSTTNFNSAPASTRDVDPTVENSNQQQAIRANDFGISITTTGPRSAIVDNQYTWSILVLNRSDRPRELNFTVIPRRDRESVDNKSSVAAASKERSHNAANSTNAIVDENTLHAFQRNAELDVGQVVCLSTDVKTGYYSTILVNHGTSLIQLQAPRDEFLCRD